MAIPPAAVPIKLIFIRLLIRVFYDVEKPFIFSHLAALTAISENEKKSFQGQRRLGLPGCLVGMNLTRAIALQSTYHCRVNNCYLHGCRVHCPLSARLPGEQVLKLTPKNRKNPAVCVSVFVGYIC